MILEDGAEHQSSLDTALAQPQAQELVRTFIGDASGRSVQGQAGPYVVILVLPHDEGLGTYHLVDGESVTVSYSSQRRTCGRCHQDSRTCPGGGWARASEEKKTPRLELREHMQKLWAESLRAGQWRGGRG